MNAIQIGSARKGTQVKDTPMVRVKGEVVSMLEDKLEELRQETEKVKGTMDTALCRLRKEGFEARVDDLRSGRWYKIAAQVAVLQEVLAVIQQYTDLGA